MVNRLKTSFINYRFRNNSKKQYELKDIIKVIKSSENRGTLLKGATKNCKNY